MLFQDFLNNLIAWALTSGIKVVIILIAAWIVVGLSKVVIKKLLKKVNRVNGEEERAVTLLKVAHSVVRTIIWVIALITLLPEFGINIGPLLAGLGIVGLALGFGARSMVADYIAGIFILLEDQYRIGDEVDIGVKGRIKSFNLRRTVIKEENGAITYIPNSQIKKTSNFSRK